MQNHVKHRIIGGLVLLAIIAIFLPFLFHSSQPSTPLKLSTQIPDQPDAPQVPLQLPENAAPAAATPTAASAPAPAIVTAQSDAVARQAKQAAPSIPIVIQPPAAKPQPTQTIKPLTSQPSVTKTSPAKPTQQSAAHALQMQKLKEAQAAIEKIKAARIAAQHKLAAEKKRLAEQQVAQAHLAKQQLLHQQAVRAQKRRAASQKLAKKPAKKLPQTASARVKTAGSVAVPTAWVVQLGSFSNSTNAKRLIKKLRARGFDAYTRQTQSVSGVHLTKVFVGPEIHKAHAARLQKRLAGEFHLRGVIRRYHT